MMKITPKKVHLMFAEWMKIIIPNAEGVIAIDGKQARRTGVEQERSLHVISALLMYYY